MSESSDQVEIKCKSGAGIKEYKFIDVNEVHTCGNSADILVRIRSKCFTISHCLFSHFILVRVTYLFIGAPGGNPDRANAKQTSKAKQMFPSIQIKKVYKVMKYKDSCTPILSPDTRGTAARLECLHWTL